MADSKYIMLRRKDADRLFSLVTFIRMSRNVFLCPGCNGKHTREEALGSVRHHKRGCWARRVELALEYDYE